MLRKLFWGINIVVALALLLSYLAPVIDPSTFSYLSILGLAFPLLCVANLLFALVWLLKRRAKAWLSVLVLVVGLPYIIRFLGFSTANMSGGGATSFSVASFNMANALLGYDRDKAKRKEKREDFEAFMDILSPTDIICLQEKGSFASDIIGRVFNEHNQHSVKDRQTAILSRFPIVDRGSIDFGTVVNSCVWADIDLTLDTIRVYSFHLSSNQISRDTKKVLKDGDLQTEKTWRGIGTILEKFRTSHLNRRDQAIRIKAHAQQSPHPVVLCGDMNDTPISYTYEVMAEDMQDSFVAKGRGLGTSYTGLLPLLRIDYVFADPMITVTSHDVVHEVRSDHYPVLVDLDLGEPATE